MEIYRVETTPRTRATVLSFLYPIARYCYLVIRYNPAPEVLRSSNRVWAREHCTFTTQSLFALD